MRMEPSGRGTDSTNSRPALIAMIVTIAVVTVFLVINTSHGLVIRAFIAVSLGLCAVALVYWLQSRRRG